MISLRARLLDDACGFRHGMVPPVQDVEATFADVEGVFNACIVGDTDSTRESSSGGFARTRAAAHAACVAEALERYAASLVRLPLASEAGLAGAPLLRLDDFALFSDEQRRTPGFPWPAPDPRQVRYAPVYSLVDNAEVWAPEALVALGSRTDPAPVPSTSTGLAAHDQPVQALLSAVEELLERDALTVTWLSSLAGRELRLPDRYVEPARLRGGEVRAFELTQQWNPHPVVVVCGFLPLRGRRRYSLGAACRPAHALEKAWLEWLQGTVFAGYYCNEHPALAFASPSEVRDFQQHGAYYTIVPEAWSALPLFAGTSPPLPAPPTPPGDPVAPPIVLAELVRALAVAGIRLYYRDLTLPDVADLGMVVVRALSPDLSLLHGDERAPFLGGRTRDVRWRYPESSPGSFPNRHPHPLG